MDRGVDAMYHIPSCTYRYIYIYYIYIHMYIYIIYICIYIYISCIYIYMYSQIQPGQDVPMFLQKPEVPLSFAAEGRLSVSQ